MDVGNAASFACFLGANRLRNDLLLSVTRANPLFVNILSIMLAAAFGWSASASRAS